MATRSVAVNLLLNPAGYTAGAAQVNRANAAMSASTTATATRATAATGAMSAGMQRTGASMGTVAAQAGLLRGGLTTPLVAAGAAVVGVTKASIDWESSWAGVTKTVDGSAEQMERLEGDLRGMAKELPATHGEIAKVAEAAGQLGVGVDDVANFSRVMIDLGETTNLSADQAATSIARFANIMGTAEGDVERLGSSLVDLGNNSATTEAEILELGTRLAAAGNIAGLSETDVLAFAAAMTSVGVNAEAGGTAMSKVFTTMRDAVLNGGAALETFAEVAGVSADEFATAFNEDPAMAIASFIEGLGRMNAAGQSTTGVFEELELTDQRLMRALLSTAEAGDLLTDSIELSSDAWDENLALSEEAERRYATTAAKLSMALNQVKDAAIDIGGIAAPVLTDAASIAADLVSGLQTGINKLRELQLEAARQSGASEKQAERTPTGFMPIDVLSGARHDIEDLKSIFGAIADEDVSGWDTFWDVLSGESGAIEESVGMLGKFKSEITGLNNRLPEATENAQGFRRAQLDVSESALTAADSLANYQEQLLAATDPVFNLQQKLIAVDEAQRAYDETLEDSEATQKDVEQAAFGVAEAVAAAEQAAINGDLSFEAFDARLNRWVEQGVISADVADDIRGRVEDLTGASEDYTGTYEAQYDAETAVAASEVQGLLNRADRWRGTHSATFIANNIVRGDVGNLLAGRGHDGGMVTTTGIQKFHGGGEVTSTIPRLHAGSSRLASDEVPAILQTGEMVLSRAQVAMMERARYLELVAREMVRLGDVTDDEWEQLLALGWQGKAGDRMEALYPPLEGVRREFIKFGEVTNVEWERLKRLGWQGKAGDRMEALYPPLESLAVEAGKAAKLLRDANLSRVGVSGARRTYDFFRSGGKSFAHIFGTGETLALGQMGEMQAGDFLRAMGKIPRAHDGASVLGADEGLAILQRGEAVVSKRDMAMAAAMAGRAIPAGGGSMGTAQQAAQIVIQHMELKAVGEPFNPAQVASKLESHMARAGAA